MPSTDLIASTMAKLDRFNQPVRKSTRPLGSYNAGAALARALGGGGPGSWSSDHRAETLKYTGWHYVAIQALMRQFQQAEIFAYDNAELYAQEKQTSIKKSGSVNTDDARGTPLPYDHPLVQLLRKPNPYQTGRKFRAEQILQMRLTGRCLIWNVPNEAMTRTVERYIIPTAIAVPEPPSPRFPLGSWKIQVEGARYGADGWFLIGPLAQLMGYSIDCREIQETRDPHPLYKDDSQSAIAAGALWTDTADMIDRSRHNHMKNGPDPSIVVTMGDNWNADEDELSRAAAVFNQNYAGVENHGKALFTTGDDVHELNTTPQEMAYDSGWEQMRDSILALHGVPPLAAGVMQASGRDGLYAPLIQFIMLTVQPLLDVIAEDDTETIGAEWDATIEYKAKAVNDPAQQEQELATDIQAGAIKVDELRILRGREPWGGEEGDAIAGQKASPMEEMFGGGGQPGKPFGGKPDEDKEGEDKAADEQKDFLDMLPQRKSIYELLRYNGNGNGKH